MRTEPEARTITGRQLLTGTRFSLSAGGSEPGTGTVSMWGRGRPLEL